MDHGDGSADNSDIVLLKPEYFQVRATQRAEVEVDNDETLLAAIRETEEQDDEVVKAVRELRAGTGVRAGEWAEHDGLVLYRGLVYVPRDEDLRRRIVQAHHDSRVTGHPGRWKTLELVSRNYWWPGISRFIDRYVRGCDACNRVKTFPGTPAGPLMPNPVPTRRWQVVTVDLIGELPQSRGYDAIFVAVDRLGKRVRIAPTNTTVESAGVARLFLHNVWRHHGLFDQVISDRGPQFVSNFTRELYRMLGIKLSASTAFHPQTDGQTERVNQEIEAYLRLFCNFQQDDWADWLPMAEFALNNRVHASTRTTPFRLDTGQDPRMGFEPRREGVRQDVRDFVSGMERASEEAQAALERAASDMARFYDAHRDVKLEFEVGDQVWLDSRNIRTTRPVKKLDDKWFGPFPITHKYSRNAYRLKLHPALKVHPTFHISLLRRHVPDTIVGRQPTEAPEPVTVDGEEQWELEAITQSRRYGRWKKLQYFVSWKSFDKSFDDWIPVENMDNARELIEEFHRAHPDAPK